LLHSRSEFVSHFISYVKCSKRIALVWSLVCSIADIGELLPFGAFLTYAAELCDRPTVDAASTQFVNIKTRHK
jgi:hypothetical protein